MADVSRGDIIVSNSLFGITSNFNKFSTLLQQGFDNFYAVPRGFGFAWSINQFRTLWKRRPVAGNTTHLLRICILWNSLLDSDGQEIHSVVVQGSDKLVSR